MKKIIILIISLLLFIPNVILAKTVNMYLFHGSGCPHCMELREFLDEYLEDKKNIKLNEYEVWNNEDNYLLFSEIQEVTNVPSRGVPYLVIGDRVIIGFGDTSKEEIINTLNYYLNTSYVDKVGEYIKNRKEYPIVIEEQIVDEIVIKTRDSVIDETQINESVKNVLKKSSNFATSIILGLLSTFNITYLLFALLFICYLLICKTKKEEYLVGLSFLIAMVISNILLLDNIFDISILLDKTKYMKVFLAFIVVLIGVINILRYLKNNKLKNNNIIIFITSLIIFIISNILVFYSNMEVPMLFSSLIGDNILYIIIYSIFGVLITGLIYLLYLILTKKNDKKLFIYGSSLMTVLGLIILFLNN